MSTSGGGVSSNVRRRTLRSTGCCRHSIRALWCVHSIRVGSLVTSPYGSYCGFPLAATSTEMRTDCPVGSAAVDLCVCSTRSFGGPTKMCTSSAGASPRFSISKTACARPFLAGSTCRKRASVQNGRAVYRHRCHTAQPVKAAVRTVAANVSTPRTTTEGSDILSTLSGVVVS